MKLKFSARQFCQTIRNYTDQQNGAGKKKRILSIGIVSILQAANGK